ncbi:MAG: hypothetical protein HQ558_00205 [Candidatus Omnitrophica bacterium]|nr:hypothetical protein [Candidatus Omnitrophota bacterium]
MAKKKSKKNVAKKARPKAKPKKKTAPLRKPQAKKAKVKKPKAKPGKAPAPARRKKEKVTPMARLLLPLGKVKEVFRTRYGFFLYDGSEFVINTPETPAPWCNIITNGDYGMIVSQAGSGMSFKGGMRNRITRWHQDMRGDSLGKFVYIRDNQTQDFWSATWKPVCKQPEFYEVRQGVGYTNISSRNNGIISSLIYYVAADEPVEIWQMRIRNVTDEERFLSVFSYLEWEFGKPSGNREYDRFFVDTSFNQDLSAAFAKTPSSEYAFHSVNHKVSTFTCGREFFIGAYRDASNPRCVEKGMCFGEKGRYYDPAAALQIEIELPPHGEKELLFTVGACGELKDAERIIKKYKNAKVVEEEFSRAGHRWTMRFNGYNIMTPDEGANILSNKWFRYQAISAGLSSHGSYNSPDNKVSFDKYMINGLTFLSINPKRHRELLLNCAEKQFEDGSVIDGWDPKTQEGQRSESVTAPLWLAYSVCEYLKETKDLSVLDEDVRFQDVPKGDLFLHCTKAIDRAFESIGKKGLPSISGTDYMRSLDGPFRQEKGESIWLGQFLVYVLSEFLAVCRLKNASNIAADYEAKLKKLKEKLTKICWNEDRFIRAISQNGRSIGIANGKNARLFLDTQVWAILSGLCEGDEARALMDNVKSQLYQAHGPAALSPSYTELDEEAGTISKLPPGVMENGGISLETAYWAIWAEAKLGRANNAWSMFTRLNPVDRSHKSDIYGLEPYVSCEYVDGADSPTDGSARNSWYNCAGYWMFKVMTEEILGIKPTLDGLLISPCIPNRWRLFKVRRTFRNAYYTIEVVNPRYVSTGVAEITVDGKKLKSNIVPAFSDDKRHHVKVIMGKPKS